MRIDLLKPQTMEELFGETGEHLPLEALAKCESGEVSRNLSLPWGRELD